MNLSKVNPLSFRIELTRKSNISLSYETFKVVKHNHFWPFANEFPQGHQNAAKLLEKGVDETVADMSPVEALKTHSEHTVNYLVKCLIESLGI